MAELENFHVYEMEVYKGRQDKASILMEGDYGYPKRHFVIVRTLLGHPCAYLEVKPDDYAANADLEYEDECRYDLFDVDVHGGPTYYGDAYWNEEDNRTYLGWDYAHYGDYDTYCASIYGYDIGYKWTLWEIFADIINACSGIRKQNGDHWEETHALPTERDGT